MTTSNYRSRPTRDADKIVEAIDRQTKDAGKWASITALVLLDGLSAIALAASTPVDNSAEVQARIDEQAAKLKASTDELEQAVEANQPQ